MQKKRFQKIHVEISNICNLQCSFCPEVIRDKKRISIHDFESVIKKVASLTELVCFHLMGDPLTHPHLNELIEICEREGVKIFFVTNGVLLRDDKLQALLSPALYQVNFSLHSFFDNYPERDPSNYLDQIFKYVDLALVARPETYINFRLWNLDSPEGKVTRNVEMLNRIQSRYSFTLPSELSLKKQKSIHIKGRLYLHFDTEFIWPALELPILGARNLLRTQKPHWRLSRWKCGALLFR